MKIKEQHLSYGNYQSSLSLFPWYPRLQLYVHAWQKHVLPPNQNSSFESQTLKFTRPLENALAPVKQMIVADLYAVRKDMAFTTNKLVKQGVPLSSNLRKKDRTHTPSFSMCKLRDFFHDNYYRVDWYFKSQRQCLLSWQKLFQVLFFKGLLLQV